MISARKVVSEIKQLVRQEGMVDDDLVAMVAGEYISVCAAVTERAGRVAELLRKGEDKRAAELIRQLPSLDSEIQALDFAEVSNWIELCDLVGMEVASAINLEGVRNTMREALTGNKKGDQLLKFLRRLSLSHAPMGQRVRVLRKLVSLKGTDSPWKEDLKQFEEVYAHDLVTTAQKAGAEGNLDLLEEVLAELSSPDWLPPRPQHAVKALERLILPHRRKKAAELYAELTERLHAAHSRLDQAACGQLREEWLQVQQNLGVAPDEAAAQQVEHIWGWLDDLQAQREADNRYDAACLQVEEALDENRDRATVEQLSNAVLRMDRGMPAALSARVNNRMEEFNRRARRQFTVTLVGIVAGVILIFGGIIAGSMHFMRQAEQKRWQESILSALDGDDLPTAAQLLGQVGEQSPHIASSAEIRVLSLRYDRMMAKEQERRKSWKAAIAAVEAAGFDQPDTQSLEQASALSKNDVERQRVLALRQKIEHRRAEIRQQLAGEFAGDLDLLREKFVIVRSADDLRRDDADNLAIACLALARRMSADTRADDAQRNEVLNIESALLERNAAKGQSIERRRQAEAAIEEVVGLIDQPTDMAQAMSKFIDNFPDHAIAGDFARCLPLIDRIGPLLAWQKIGRTWRAVTLSKQDEVEAQIAAIEEYLAAHASSPQAAAAQSYSHYLTVAAAAWEYGTLRHLDAVKADLTARHMTGLHQLTTKNGKVYYVAGLEDIKPGFIDNRIVEYHLEYLTDVSRRLKEKARLDLSEISGEPGTAAHVLLAAKLATTVSRFRQTGWETLYLRLAGRVQTATDIDPILKAILLKRLLTYARDCTPWQTDEIQKIIAALSKVDLDVAWANPEDHAANESRPLAAEALAALPDISELVADVEARMTALGQACHRKYKPAGLYLPEKFQEYAPKVTATGKLHATLSDGKMRAIGSVVDGKTVIDEQLVQQIPAGLLLFTEQ